MPFGINDFTTIREDNFIYIDKTYYLQKLIENDNRYFLSAHSGFGKSLLLSTLTAMFSGKKELFHNISAYDLSCEFLKKPYPVLNFNLSILNATSIDNFKASFDNILNYIVVDFCVDFSVELQDMSLDKKSIRFNYNDI